MSRRLYLATWPQINSDGKCRAFTVMRPDGKTLSSVDLQNIRVAFGQEPLSDEEIDSYGIDDWSEVL